MLGTIFGVTLMGVLANGIVLMDISPYWVRVIVGAVVMAAVLVDLFRVRRCKRCRVSTTSRAGPSRMHIRTNATEISAKPVTIHGGRPRGPRFQ